MTAFIVGHLTVKDPQKWAEYRAKVRATLKPHGGEVLLRGSRIAILAGEHAHTDVVLIRFPDAAAAKRWYDSPTYQALIPLRKEAAEMVLISYES